jgi:hypothetical protein
MIKQQAIAERFAGRTRDNEDRFAELDTFRFVYRSTYDRRWVGAY